MSKGSSFVHRHLPSHISLDGVAEEKKVPIALTGNNGSSHPKHSRPATVLPFERMGSDAWGVRPHISSSHAAQKAAVSKHTFVVECHVAYQTARRLGAKKIGWIVLQDRTARWKNSAMKNSVAGSCASLVFCCPAVIPLLSFCYPAVVPWPR